MHREFNPKCNREPKYRTPGRRETILIAIRLYRRGRGAVVHCWSPFVWHSTQTYRRAHTVWHKKYLRLLTSIFSRAVRFTGSSHRASGAGHDTRPADIIRLLRAYRLKVCAIGAIRGGYTSDGARGGVNPSARWVVIRRTELSSAYRFNIMSETNCAIERLLRLWFELRHRIVGTVQTGTSQPSASSLANRFRGKRCGRGCLAGRRDPPRWPGRRCRTRCRASLCPVAFPCGCSRHRPSVHRWRRRRMR